MIDLLKLNFKSLYELMQTFPDEQTCIEHLEWQRWHGKTVSPYDSGSKVYKCKGNNYRCRNTGKYFNVRTNTMFHHSPIPLRKWYMAIWLMVIHKKGISSVQLAKNIGVTQKTAWFMAHRIRKCYDLSKHYLSGTVEIDETFIGGKNKNRHRDKKVPHCQGRSFKDKVPVFGMLQRGGNIVARVVANTKAVTLRKEIRKTIKEGSTIYSDEWNYGNLSNKYQHQFIDHSRKIYGIGDVYTNTIEGFWSIVKRAIIGTYHVLSKKHLQKYIDEFTYRYNTRKMTIFEAFNSFLGNIQNRLTYNELTHG